MACTASRSVKAEVIASLEMTDCVQVTASPDRPNIYYQVKVRADIETDFLPLLDTLRRETVHTPRVLVYCDTCADLYAHFHYELGNDSYYPPGSPTTGSLECFMLGLLNTTRCHDCSGHVVST